MTTLDQHPARAFQGRRQAGGRWPVGLAVGWLALPVVPLLMWAFTSRWSGPVALPQQWGLTGWRSAFGAGVSSAAARSFALGLLVAAVATPLGAMAGRALGWGEVRRPRAAAAILLAPVVLPPFAVSMGLDVVILRTGAPDLMAVLLVLSVFALPYTTYTMRAAYRGIDEGLEEQARMLGATPRQARRRATLPAVRAGLLVSAGLAFLIGWSDYVVTLLVGGGQLITVPVLLGSTASGTGREATVAVLSLVTVAPLLVALLVGRVWTRRRTGGRR